MLVHYDFCPRCGAKLIGKDISGEGLIPYCPDCRQLWFDSYSSCVIVLTYNEYNEIAMTLQPHLTTAHWVYTSGYINPGESAEHAAIREVKEELGLDVQKLHTVGTFWFQKGGMLMHAYLAYTPKKDFVLSDEVAEAKWTDAYTAARLQGPIRPGCADFFMLKDFVEMNNICTSEDLWPGQELT